MTTSGTKSRLLARALYSLLHRNDYDVDRPLLPLSSDGRQVDMLMVFRSSGPHIGPTRHVPVILQKILQAFGRSNKAAE
jgi:hypothetical protein